MANWIQVKSANPAKMGTQKGWCLKNTRLAFGINKGTFASAKADMLSQKANGTLHPFSTIPSNLAVPIYINSISPNKHIGLWYKGVYYSNGKRAALPIKALIYGWGELCDGVRVVKLGSSPKPSSKFLPAKGYWKKGDKDQRIADLASFMRKTFPSYTNVKALGPIFGNYLESSIKTFQRKTGLGADGMVGPKTYAMLQKYGFKG